MGLITFGGIASATFSVGGPGAAIVQLLLIAAFGALIEIILRTLNQSQIAGFVKIITVFSCIGIVIAQILKAIMAVCRGFGVQL